MSTHEGGEETVILATDGFELAASIYRPAHWAGGDVVVVAGATALHQGFYRHFAQYLADRGLLTVTFDYRGMGRSGPRRLQGLDVSMRDWGDKDIPGVLDWVQTTLQPRRVLGVAHSAGGQMLGLAPNNHIVSRLLAVAAPSGYWRLFPWPRRYLVALLMFVVMPGLAWLLSYFPARRLGLGENLPAGVARQWARWCRHRDYLVGDDGAPLRCYFEAFESPILSYSFADDPLAPKPTVDALMGFYTSAPIVRRHIDDRRVGHLGFFRRAGREAFWAHSATWLEAQEPADSTAAARAVPMHAARGA